MPVGLFGKYPGKRDFVAHNLPAQILRPLEDWLQAGVAASKQVLGNEWQARFLVQPFWNFRLGQAIVGTDCIGTFMPSVDGVGRYFPLCAVSWTEEAGYGYPLSSAFEFEDWFSDVQARLLSTLDDDTPSTPQEILEGLAPAKAIATRKPELLRISGDDCNSPLTRDARVSLYAAELAERDMSLWWATGGSAVKPQIIASGGMPDPYIFAEMMGAPAARTD